MNFHHFRRVRYVVNKYIPVKHPEYEDGFAEGCLAVIQNRGIFSYFNVRNAILKYLKEQRKHSHQRIIEDQIWKHPNIYNVTDYLPKMESREEKLWGMLAGGFSAEDIAGELKISRSYVYKLIRKLKEKIRQAN